MAQVQLAVDTFQRANENPLSNGGVWTAFPSFPLQIVSDVVTQIGGTSGGYALYTGMSWPRSQYSEITLGAGDSVNNAYYVLYVRADIASGTAAGAFNNIAEALIPTALGVSGTALLRVYIQGNYTNVVSATVTPVLGDVWRYAAVGNVFTLTQNGTTVATWTPTTDYPYEGIPGFGVYDAGNVAVHITKWAGGGTADPTTRRTMLSDNFNRANGGMGTNWTQLIVANPPQILSDILVANSSGGGGYPEYTGSALGTQNYWAQTVVPTIAAATTNAAGPIVRANTPGSDNDYSLFNYQGSIYIQKRLAGAFSTNLASSAWVPVAGDRYRLEVSGTTLTSFANNIFLNTATDSGISTGNPGLLIFSTVQTSPTINLFTAGIYAPNVPNSLMQMGSGT